MLSRLRLQSAEQAQAKARADAYRNLIRKEAVIGGTLFGALPKGHRRKFFCLDEHTWVWHEEWLDKLGRQQVRTTRYNVRPSGIVKIQDGKGYQALSPTETAHLREAAQLYFQRVSSELYQQVTS